MLQKIFCVWDDKAKAYLPPFFLPEVGMAVRVFGDCINDATHNFGRHPEDYTLFRLGTFDQSKGLLVAEATLECVAHGLELKRRMEDSAQRSLPFVNGFGARLPVESEIRGPLTVAEGSKS